MTIALFTKSDLSIQVRLDPAPYRERPESPYANAVPLLVASHKFHTRRSRTSFFRELAPRSIQHDSPVRVPPPPTLCKAPSHLLVLFFAVIRILLFVYYRFLRTAAQPQVQRSLGPHCGIYSLFCKARRKANFAPGNEV